MQQHNPDEIRKWLDGMMRVWRWPWCDSDCANFQMSKKPVYWLRGIVARERRLRRYDLAYMDAALSIPHTPPTGAWTSLTERNGFALFAPLPTLLRAYSRDQTYIKVSWVGVAMRLQNMRLSDICGARIYVHKSDICGRCASADVSAWPTLVLSPLDFPENAISGGCSSARPRSWKVSKVSYYWKSANF